MYRNTKSTRSSFASQVRRNAARAHKTLLKEVKYMSDPLEERTWVKQCDRDLVTFKLFAEAIEANQLAKALFIFDNRMDMAMQDEVPARVVEFLMDFEAGELE